MSARCWAQAGRPQSQSDRAFDTSAREVTRGRESPQDAGLADRPVEGQLRQTFPSTSASHTPWPGLPSGISRVRELAMNAHRLVS